MALKIRAIYRDGQIRLLDPVELHEGQQMTINIEPISENEALRTVLGDSVQWPDPNYDEDAWVEDMAEELAQKLSAGRSLSDIIIEERNSGW